MSGSLPSSNEPSQSYQCFGVIIHGWEDEVIQKSFTCLGEGILWLSRVDYELIAFGGFYHKLGEAFWSWFVVSLIDLGYAILGLYDFLTGSIS